MALQEIHSRNLIKAHDNEVCIRILRPHSSHWKPPPENKPTSAAYDDNIGELSVDLADTYPSKTQLEQIYSDKIQSNGIGLSCAITVNIRSELVNKTIDGNVWKDPIPDNSSHGIITGNRNKKKKEALRDIFNVEIPPKNIQEIFGQ